MFLSKTTGQLDRWLLRLLRLFRLFRLFRLLGLDLLLRIIRAAREQAAEARKSALVLNRKASDESLRDREVVLDSTLAQARHGILEGVEGFEVLTLAHLGGLDGQRHVVAGIRADRCRDREAGGRDHDERRESHCGEFVSKDRVRESVV